MQDRRSNPCDDVATVVATAEFEGRPLGDWAIGLMLLLLIGVSDTTAGLISNGITLLADHPAVRRQLVAQPELIHGAIEEVLRFDSPIQNAKRVTTRPVLLRDLEIPEGARVFLFFGSANRDEDRFVDSERFIVTRAPNPHLAFGAGVHRCIGAPLARLEGEIAISEFLRRWPEFEVAGSATRHNSNVMRSFDALPLAVQETSAR
jgi:cytochrome P450 family 109